MEGKANYGIKDRLSYSKGKLTILNCSESDYEHDVMTMLCYIDETKEKV